MCLPPPVWLQQSSAYGFAISHSAGGQIFEADVAKEAREMTVTLSPQKNKHRSSSARLRVWVLVELHIRGWSREELAIRAGIPGELVRDILDSNADFTTAFLRGMCSAFDDIPKEEILRRASLDEIAKTTLCELTDEELEIIIDQHLYDYEELLRYEIALKRKIASIWPEEEKPTVPENAQRPDLVLIAILLILMVMTIINIAGGL